MYPNPAADGIFNFILKEESVDLLDVNVYNAIGKRVGGFVEKNSLVSSHEIRLTDEAPGVYFLVVRTEKGVVTQKLLKSR